MTPLGMPTDSQFVHHGPIDIRFNAASETLSLRVGGIDLVALGWCYELTVLREADHRETICLQEMSFSRSGEIAIVSGHFGGGTVTLRQTLRASDDTVIETIQLFNDGSEELRIEDISIGWILDMSQASDWRLCAVPFRVQLDGSLHEYSADQLAAGDYRNSYCEDLSAPPRTLLEEGRLRSEAWVWGDGSHGLLVAKYNAVDIEYSIARPMNVGGKFLLKMGGVGTCLYGEPERSHRLKPGASFSFGESHFRPFRGGIEAGFGSYKRMLNAMGHDTPRTYAPPLIWNVLYDLGWHHSDQEALSQFYTRETVFQEAQKAKDYGCEMLYFDPGWEVAEGTTKWDERRLGKVGDMIATLDQHYGLKMGFRTIMRSYSNEWPLSQIVDRTDSGREKRVGFVGVNGVNLEFWEMCLSCQDYFNEKLRRIQEICRQGVRFLMVDEFDWRGPCLGRTHHHECCDSAAQHVRMVQKLCLAIRARNPELVIECHDPIWPWSTSRYLPVYFGQGFGLDRPYQENWGFEFMWNCLDDLKTGKAMSLYYYNLATNIPLYLHITSAADNDNCLFFWWAASTVRHLGIGGRYGNATVSPPDLPTFDVEKRAARYKEAICLYKRFRPFFTQGEFHGLAEFAHLHTLKGAEGAVLMLFNLTEQTHTFQVRIPRAILEVARCSEVSHDQDGDDFVVTKVLPPMSPLLVPLSA